LQRAALEVADDIEQAAEGYLRSNPKTWTYIEHNVRGGTMNFPQFAAEKAPNLAGQASTAARYYEGRLNSVAVYDPMGKIAARIDIFSRSNRHPENLPELHLFEPGVGKGLPGIPMFDKFHHSGRMTALR
jgi:hypothetical protein